MNIMEYPFGILVDFFSQSEKREPKAILLVVNGETKWFSRTHLSRKKKGSSNKFDINQVANQRSLALKLQGIWQV